MLGCGEWLCDGACARSVSERASRFLGEHDESCLSAISVFLSLMFLAFSHTFNFVDLFKNHSNLFAFFHVLPHGPIKSQFFLFIMFFWRVIMTCIYRYIFLEQVRNSDNILEECVECKWGQMNLSCCCFHSKAVINMNVLLRIYILSVMWCFLFDFFIFFNFFFFS